MNLNLFCNSFITLVGSSQSSEKENVMFISEQDIQKVVTQLASNWTTKSIQTSNEASKFLKKRNVNVHKIYKRVKEKKYKFKKFNQRKIAKTNGKHRTVYNANFTDSITLHILFKYLQKHLDPCFPLSAIAFRTGKNLRSKALKFAYHFHNTESPDLKSAKIDIKSYYDNVDTNILINKLENFNLEESAMALLRNIFSMYNFLPQGIASMNLLANLYLSEIDSKYIKIGQYFRYADDIFIILEKIDPRVILNEIEKDLTKLKLEINKSKSQIISPHENFEYLGFFFKNGEMIIRHKSQRKFQNKIKRILRKSIYTKLTYTSIQKQNTRYLFSQMIDEINSYIIIDGNKSWLRNYVYLTNVKQLKFLDKWIRDRIRHKLTKTWGKKNYQKVPSELFIKSQLHSLINEYYFQTRRFNSYTKTKFEFFFSIRYLDKIHKNYQRNFPQKFIDKKREELLIIQKILRNQEFHWHDFKLSKNPFGKDILILDPIDKIVIKILSDYISTTLHVKKKSIYKAVDRYLLLMKQGTYKYLIKLDIKSFNQDLNINHILDESIKGRISEYPFTLLKNFFLKLSNTYKIKGLPRGVAINSTLSEVFLNDLESKLKEMGIKHIRYADDFTIATNKNPDQIIDQFSSLLAAFGLSINKGKLEVFPKSSQISFLGYQGEKTKGSLLISINKFHFYQLKRKIKRATRKRKYHKGKKIWLKETIKRINKIVSATKKFSSLRYYSKVNNFTQLKDLDSFIYHRLRIGCFRRNNTRDFQNLTLDKLKDLGLKSCVKEVHKRKKMIYNIFRSKISR